MTDAVDADELLRRIRAARDWAAQEEQLLKTEADEADDGALALGLTIRSSAVEAVRKVLDEIIEPGTHRKD